MARMTFALSKDNRGDKRGNTGIDMDDGSAREIKGAAHADETAHGPDPMADGIINKSCPQNGKDTERGEFHAFRESAQDQTGSNDREHRLKNHEHLMRNRCGI